ncbi:MAG: glucosaminidase domain-containing protein [Bacteroidota bacterium]|nr:glucosaminidase domain-containing protein [Bacteroidota bacterium]
MSRTIISILLLTLLSLPESPGLKENQKEFILGFAPKIFEANENISKTRARIIQIRTEFKSTGRLSNEEEVFISRLSKNYGLNTFKLDDEKDHDALLAEINALLLRVDIIPPRLIMAQAIIESGWGKSYFAKQANNYFGVHCYNKGCGIPQKAHPMQDLK